ncbi:uncharacterized protein LOC131875382 [Cryptomeria japonica]|uniref:uncharacterized protein LOC131875382 n=1 Tax=Cryptomeria japonica TaxID=3369 RepID=UPI0027D9E3DC|nr:uncharacterized protein LOC131875382 [Cryptomeria japonica]
MEFNEEIAREFTHTLSNGEAQLKGLRVVVTEERIAEEKRKEKQVDIEHKEKKSKNENLPPPAAKKRKILKSVPVVTVKVVEELATGSSLSIEKGKSQRSSDRLRKKFKSQDQPTKPNITILIDSPQQKQHSPLHDDIPPSPPNEPQRDHEEEELQNIEEERELQLQEEGELQDIEQPQKEVVFERLDNLTSTVEQVIEAGGKVESKKPKAPVHRPPTSLTSHAVGLVLYEDWELEKVKMQMIIDYQKKVIEQKGEEIAQLKAKVEIVATMVPQLMQCRAPPCVYSLYLREHHVLTVLD